MKILTLFGVIILSFNLFSQSPREVVQSQLEAYNAKDIEAFIKVFSDDIELWSLGDSLPKASGIKNVKKVYLDLFKRSPSLHSEVINRTTIGNKVIDYEKITGRSGTEESTLFLIMIYEIENGKIFRATSVRE